MKVPIGLFMLEKDYKKGDTVLYTTPSKYRYFEAQEDLSTGKYYWLGEEINGRAVGSNYHNTDYYIVVKEVDREEHLNLLLNRYPDADLVSAQCAFAIGRIVTSRADGQYTEEGHIKACDNLVKDILDSIPPARRDFYSADRYIAIIQFMSKNDSDFSQERDKVIEYLYKQ